MKEENKEIARYFDIFCISSLVARMEEERETAYDYACTTKKKTK